MNHLERTAIETRQQLAIWQHIKGNWIMLLCAIISAFSAVYWANKYFDLKNEIRSCITNTVDEYRIYICDKEQDDLHR